MHHFKIDLHIHSALSPCAEKEMTPPRIIHAAKAKGLKMIAVTDHNTAENVSATIKAAEESGIFVIPGMEVQTQEEVHVICLFPTIESCLSWQKIVYAALPQQPNRSEIFGSQPIMDSLGQIVGEVDQMLLLSTGISLEDVVEQVTSLGGICIPAHVDRPSFSVIATLGFIPDDLPIQAVEISRHSTVEEVRFLLPSIKKYTLISSSDAHRLTEIGSNPTQLFLANPPDFTALRNAISNFSERRVIAKMKDLSMHIIDIMQNSIEAGATEIRLLISECTVQDCFSIEITDNGRGMSAEILAKATDPFFTSRKTRQIGLGIPLLKAAAERCEGEMILDSTPGKGTSIRATFRHSHIDRAPLGNIVDTIVNTIMSSPDLNLSFRHRINDREITFDAAELRTQLEDVPLNNQAVINWIKNFLTDSYNEIQRNNGADS